MENQVEELNELAKKHNYRFSESANTAPGCTNMYQDGKILIGNGTYKQCIDVIKKREEIKP